MQRFCFQFVAIVLAFLLLLGPSPAFAATVDCRGTIGAVTVDNVRVPDDATCTLDGTRVEGNVFVETNATLWANDVTVDGSVQAEGHARVEVRSGSTVGGSVQIKQGGSARVEQVHVNGDLQLEQNNGTFALSGNVIGGNLQANQNQGTGLTIEDNVIDGNLQCQANDPPPVGGNNVAAELEDQCEDLSGAGQRFRQYLPVLLGG